MPIIFIFILALAGIIILADIVFFVSGIYSFLSGAPFVPLAKRKVEEALEKGGLSEKDIFCDLGCGAGNTLMAAVEKFNVRKAIGWEIAPFPFIIAKTISIRSRKKDRIEIHFGNLFLADISHVTFIYIYLLPEMIDKVVDKIAKEALIGTKIICPSFPINTIKHPQFDLIAQMIVYGTPVYLYQKKVQ